MGGWASAIGGIAGGIASGLNEGRKAEAEKKRQEKFDTEMKEWREVITRQAPAPPEQTTPESRPERVPGTAARQRFFSSPSLHKGGRITKTGNYKLREGELVIPAKLARRVVKRYTGGR